jgi:hypothetical protein
MLTMCPPPPHQRGRRLSAEERGEEVEREQPIVARDRRGSERGAVEDRSVPSEAISAAARRAARPERW